jgi:hypothetical protein
MSMLLCCVCQRRLLQEQRLAQAGRARALPLLLLLLLSSAGPPGMNTSARSAVAPLDVSGGGVAVCGPSDAAAKALSREGAALPVAAAGLSSASAWNAIIATMCQRSGACGTDELN